MIPALRGVGHRCIAPDLPGFGHSDKPLDIGWDNYDRHVAALAPLAEDLDVHVIADASHFLQEDAGPQIGALIADWLNSGP